MTLTDEVAGTLARAEQRMIEARESYEKWALYVGRLQAAVSEMHDKEDKVAAGLTGPGGSRV